MLSRSRPLTTLDVGCGTGWFVNTVAFHYGRRADGIDISVAALDRATKVSEMLGLAENVTFHREDLFEPRTSLYSLVNSLGVLHHMYDIASALASVAARVEPKGFLHLGLYHRYGRAPFLGVFTKYRMKHALGQLGPDELDEAFQLYQRMQDQRLDRRFLVSWFRDQVLHPHESQHTLKEIVDHLRPLGFVMRSTSINHFAPIKRVEDLYALEKDLYELSYERNVRQHRYFAGFFTILAQKEPE